MPRDAHGLLALLTLWFLFPLAPAMAEPLAPVPAEAPFAAEINAFAAADAASPPKPCPILFVGSSTIRFWRGLAADMAPYDVVNRGFGGSQIANVDAYFDRVVAPYHPRAIVFYAGDNDIHAGKAPAAVAADFDTFLGLKDKALGATPVYFISLKPSKARFGELAAQGEVNRLVKAEAARRRDLIFIDVTQAMLADGQPKDIFVADGLHMTPAGYALWTPIVHGALDQTGPARLPCPR